MPVHSPLDNPIVLLRHGLSLCIKGINAFRLTNFLLNRKRHERLCSFTSHFEHVPWSCLNITRWHHSLIGTFWLRLQNSCLSFINRIFSLKTTSIVILFRIYSHCAHPVWAEHNISFESCIYSVTWHNKLRQILRWPPKLTWLRRWSYLATQNVVWSVQRLDHTATTMV